MLQDTTTSRMKPAIALEGISKSFPGVRALAEVSLALYPGSVTALVGENGAGKSTLVKILTGIYQPDEGTIRVDGAEAHFPTAQRGGKSRRHRHPPGNRAVRRTVGRREHLFGPCPPHPLRPSRLEDDERERPRLARPRRGRSRSGDPPARSRHRQQTPRRHRPRTFHRRPRRHHGRADGCPFAQGNPRALRPGRPAEGGRQGDPLHQPQVRRDFPYRRSLHGVSRWLHGGRGADFGGDAGRSGAPDGRPRCGPSFPETGCRHRRTRSHRFRLPPPDRIRGHQFRAASRRDPWLLRSCRGGPFGVSCRR